MEDSKRCTKCHIEKPLSGFHIDRRKRDGHFSACKKCANEATVNCQKKNPRIPDARRRGSRIYRTKLENRLKIISRSLVNKALRKGLIEKSKACMWLYTEKSPCNGRIEAHHQDYSKPLEVMWLCKKHHEIIHY